MLGGADNSNGELQSYIIGANNGGNTSWRGCAMQLSICLCNTAHLPSDFQRGLPASQPQRRPTGTEQREATE